MYPKRLVQHGRHTVLEIAEEGLHCGEPRVARTGLVVAHLFDVFEKGEDGRHVNILDLQQARSLAQSTGGECDQ